MEDIPLLDYSSVSTTDKLCFMILDHLRRAEDEFAKFKKELLDAKRMEKYIQIKECITKFDESYSDRRTNNEYVVHYSNCDNPLVFFDNKEHDLAISMIIKKLSKERITSLWQQLFPNHDVDTLLELWEESNVEWMHIVFGIEHDSLDEDKRFEKSKQLWYTEENVKALLNELTMTEVASIHPKIYDVTFQNIELP